MADDFTLPSDSPPAQSSFVLPSDRPPTGTGESAFEGALSGASAGWRDEIRGASVASGMPEWLGGFRAPVGAARLAYEHLTGQPGSASQEYQRAVDEIRARQKQMQTEHPYAYGAGELAGAGASMLATPGLKATTALGRLGEGALVGGVYGGLSGAGEAEGGLSDRALGAASGAVTGAGLGAGSAAAIEAARPLLRPITEKIASTYRGMVDPEAEASRQMLQAAKSDWENAGKTWTPLTREQASAADTAGLSRSVVDVMGPQTRSLGEWAASQSPHAEAALKELTGDRFKQQGPRIGQFIQDMTGGGDLEADRVAIKAAGRAVNRPAYEKAYAAGDREIWSPELERLTAAPYVQSALGDAISKWKNYAVRDGYGAMNPPFRIENGGLIRTGGGMQVYPNIQLWDYAARELQDRARAAPIGSQQATLYNDLARGLKNELDRIVPEYGQARAGAASFFGANNALEAGSKFVSQQTSFDLGKANAALAKMSPEERQLFARGFATELSTRVLRGGDNRNLLNSTFLGNPQARQRIEMALGPANARQLEALLRAEEVVNSTRNLYLGSPTARRLAMQATMGVGFGGGEAGLEYLTKGSFDPAHVFGATLLPYLAGRGAQVLNQRLAARLGEMLTSDNPGIYAKGIQLAARNPRAFNALRRATAGSSAGAVSPPKLQSLAPAGAEENQHQRGGRVNHQPNEGQEGKAHGGATIGIRPESVNRQHGGRVSPQNIDVRPTEAQKKAGNYAKDHVHVHGLDITIENAKGQKRFGKDKDGKEWSVKMPSHYGYIKKTEGKDGDHVDVYLGPHIRSPRVFVIDQRNAETGKFDEHKAFLGFPSKIAVIDAYQKAFSDGKAHERMGHLSEMTIDQFKAWLKAGDQTKPIKAAA